MSINSVSISGNLTRDPELRTANSGMSILRLGVAVNERRKVGDEWEDYANFVDVTVFGKRGEALSRFLAKGTKVAITGKLHQNRWEAQDGSKRSAIEVIADEVDVMQKSGGSSSGSEPRYEDVRDDLGAEEIPFAHRGFTRGDSGHWHHRRPSW